MKIEVIAAGKGSITIKTDSDDYSSAEIMSMARRAANITSKMLREVGASGTKKFGFEAGVQPEDASLSPTRATDPVLDVDHDVPGYLPGDAR
ncbi:hypothetical protein [Lentzea sp. E54]|uniref:hypothetical protein n=1 Tax=Lentzea xerophila TaxID=3435883 RepID=UPI003DA54E74